jgi:hypothetical protein
MVRELRYVLPDETVDWPGKTLEQWIERADKRGDKTFKIQTPDGFTVYERFYKYKPDGTKKIISKNYLREDELTPKEAVEAMLNKEHLVDYRNPPDIARYRWDGRNFIQYDSYVWDKDKVISKFNGLRRYVKNEKIELEREKIRVK